MGEPTCKRLDFAGGVDLGGSTIAQTYRLYRQSVFCLSPGGFNIIRKGVIDALMNGCVPVLFLRVEEVRQLWPWHWWWWRANSSVLVEPRAFIRGEVDLAATLAPSSRYSPMRVAAMQQTLAAHMHSLCYMQGRSHQGDDATDILLRGLAFGLPGDEESSAAAGRSSTASPMFPPIGRPDARLDEVLG